MKQVKFKAILLTLCYGFCSTPGYCEGSITTSKTEKVSKTIKESADKVKSVLTKAKDEIVKGIEKGKEKIMHTKKTNGFTPDDFKFEEFQHIDVSKCEKPNVVEVKSNFERPIWFVKTEGSTVNVNIKFRNEGCRSFYKRPYLQSILLQSLMDNVGGYGQSGFDQKLKDNAISMSVANTDDDIIVSISCLKEYYSLALSMLGELLTQSNLPENTIEQKKLERISEIGQTKSDTREMAEEKLSNLIAIPEYDYSHDEALRLIPTYTKADIVECYKTLFDSRNAEITVVGNVSTEQLKAGLNKFFDVIKDRHNDFNGGEQKTELKTQQSKYEHVELDNANATICFAFPGVALTDEDRFAIYIVNCIWGNNGLTSRLFKDIRETQHLVYTIGTIIKTSDLQVYLHGVAKTNPQYIKAVISGLIEQCQNLHDNGITEQELSDIKLRLVASHVLDCPTAIMSFVLDRRADNATVATINEHFEKYSKLTVADVNRALKKVFDPTKLVVVSCGKTVDQVSKADPSVINKEQAAKTTDSDKPIQKKTAEDQEPKETNSENEFPIEEAVLENGLRIIVCNVPSSKDAVHFGIGYFVGSADDPRDIVGASHFLEHMAFKESENIPAGEMDHFLSTFTRYTNAYTCCDWTFYTQECNIKFLDALMKIEAERMSNAKFLENTVAEETSVILAEREMSRDSNPYRKYIDEIIMKNFYLYSNYSYETIGYVDQIKNCKANRLEEHYKRYYKPNNAVVIVAGRISLKKVVDACQRNFGHIAHGGAVERSRVIDPEDIDVSSTITYRNPQISQKKLTVIYKIPHKQITTLKQEITIDLINDILFSGDSSVLNEKINNKLELAYGIGGYVHEHAYDAVPWVICMTLKTNEVEFDELETKICKTISNFLELKAPSSIKERFERAKNSFKLRYKQMMDNPSEMNWFLITELLTNRRSVSEIRDTIDTVSSITFDEFMTTAKELLKDSRRVLVVRSEPSTKNKN